MPRSCPDMGSSDQVSGGGGSEIELAELGGIAGIASGVGRLSMFASKANTSCGRCADRPFRSEQIVCRAEDPPING